MRLRAPVNRELSWRLLAIASTGDKPEKIEILTRANGLSQTSLFFVEVS